MDLSFCALLSHLLLCCVTLKAAAFWLLLAPPCVIQGILLACQQNPTKVFLRDARRVHCCSQNMKLCQEGKRGNKEHKSVSAH